MNALRSPALSLSISLFMLGITCAASQVAQTGSRPATPPANIDGSTRPQGGPNSPASLPAQESPVIAQLRNLVENKIAKYILREEDRAGVKSFYAGRGYTPLWAGAAGEVSRAKEAISFLHQVAADGLEPDDYPTPNFTDVASDQLAVDELKLTNSLLTYVRHASTGRVAFSRVSGSIFFDLQFPKADELLANLATTPDLLRLLDSFNPQHAQYRALKVALAKERDAASRGKFSVLIPPGPPLRPGMTDSRIPLLRTRMQVAGSNGSQYDRELLDAVEKFQTKSGLHADGVVGTQTLAMLNADSAVDRSDAIIANMERWRWLPHKLGDTYVMVNIADYTLHVVHHNELVWSTRIVVGKPGQYSTPLLTETMKYITVNPTWNVPPSIIRNEYLPALQRDSGALARMGLEVHQNRDGSLHVSQPPGERNALGRLRFNFPNRFLVYQHDTPQKHLFERPTRAYSHGCMRVQDPERYAEVLLSISQPEDGYTVKRLRALYGKTERTIPLKNPIPVYITYQTMTVDGSGRIEMRADIYGIDKEIGKLLNDRSKADVAVARNYNSSSKPVVSRIFGRGREKRLGHDHRDFSYGPHGWQQPRAATAWRNSWQW